MKVHKTFEKAVIDVLYLPGKSPDLNHMENLRTIVKARLRKKNDRSTIQNLTAAVIQV